MKANITRGKAFKGLIRYISDRERIQAGNKKAEYIGGTVLESSVEEMIGELLIPLTLRKCKKPCYHISLSLPLDERLSKETWNAIMKSFLNKMDIPTDTPWCAYRHQDTAHDHVHICLSRVSLSGKIYHGQHEAYKAILATQQIEKEFGLIQTKGLEASSRKHISRGERKMIERKQELSDKQVLKIYITKAISKSDSIEELVLNLDTDYGIQVFFNSSKDGTISGISFQKGPFVVKGSQLGKAFSYGNISKKLPSIKKLTVNNHSNSKTIRTR